MNITRDCATAFIRFRLLLIGKARGRDELRRMACVGREDLDLMIDLGLITAEEKIRHECDLSHAVQARMNELIPVRLRVSGGAA